MTTRSGSTTSSSASSSRVSWRRALEWSIPIVAVLVTLLVPLVLWGRLPDPMASHWGLSGAPDQSLPKIAEVALITIVTAIVGAGPLLAARAPMPRISARLLVAIATGTSVLLAALRVVTVRANLDVASWEAAGAVTGGTMAGAFAVAIAVGLVGAWLAGDRPDTLVTTSAPAAVDIAPGEAVVWSGTTSGRVGIVASALLLVVAVLGAWVAGPARVMLLIMLPILAVVLAGLSQVQVTIGPRGLQATLGWFGWPRLRVPIEAVEDVRVEDVNPAAYGGWGLRSVPGVTAVVVRRGEGLRIERASGRAIVITIDGAAEAAGVLLSHASEHRRTHG